MNDRTASSSRSATDLNNYGIAKAFKRTRGQDETPTTPLLSVTNTLGNTTSSESMETVVNTYTDSIIRNTARKLDRLYDKQARFESHQQFLQRCLQAAVIPQGLQIELEPSIGNHNDEFLAKWNDKLVKFSRELTQDVIEFCGTTVSETVAKISLAKDDLKKNTNQVQLNDITATLDKNQGDRIHQLKRNKDKKFFKLKYNMKPRPTRQYLTSEDEWSDHRQAPQKNQHEKQHRNNQDPSTEGNKVGHWPNNKKTNQQRNLRSRNNSWTNLSNRPHSRNNSRTAFQPECKQQDDTSLLERVRQLEAQLQSKPDAPTTADTAPSTARRTTPHHQEQNGNKEQTYSAVVQQKNLISASSNSPGAPPKINEMLDYITATMDTLNNFKQHLTTLQDTNPTHSEMC